MTTLKHQAVSSVRWNAVSQVIKLSLYFLTSIILARLLQPKDFGFLGMATVFTNFVAILNDFGLGSAIIQKENPDQETLSGVFWFAVLIGLVAMGITLLFSPLIARFYQEGQLKALLSLLSINFLLTSLGQIQLSLLMKGMEFKKVAIIESLSSLAGSLVAVIMAFLNYGVWCLVAQIIVTSGLATLILWISVRWKPGIHFGIKNLKGIIRYSGGLFGFNVFNYFSRNADYLLIGRFIGAEPLGLYTFAYRLMQYPMQNITGVVNRVLFPTLAQVKNDNERFRKGYIHVSKMVASIMFPLFTGILCLSSELTIVIFGAKWQLAIPIVQIFALVGLAQSIGGMVGNIYTAKGNTGRLFYWGICSSIIVVSGIVIGLKWGILGVAIGYASASFLLFYPSLAIPFHLINLKVSDYLLSLKKIMLIVISMGLILILSSSIQKMIGAPQIVIIFSNMLLGMLFYTFALRFIEPMIFSELIKTVFIKSSDKVLKCLKL